MQVFLESKSGRMKHRNKQNRSSIVPIFSVQFRRVKFFYPGSFSNGRAKTDMGWHGGASTKRACCD